MNSRLLPFFPSQCSDPSTLFEFPFNANVFSDTTLHDRGVGVKLGLMIQFTVTFVGGLAYAFYSSWQTSLVVLCTVPFMVRR